MLSSIFSVTVCLYTNVDQYGMNTSLSSWGRLIRQPLFPSLVQLSGVLAVHLLLLSGMVGLGWGCRLMSCLHK